jgi:hypothetical protein
VKRTLVLTIFINLLLLFLLTGPALAIGVAMGPQTITIDNAVRGSEYERVVTVTNPDTQKTSYDIRAEGPAGGWLSFFNWTTKEPITNFDLEGQSNVQILIRVEVPEDIANDTYTAIVYAETATFDVPSESGGVTTKLQSRADLTITVTGDQKVTGTVGALAVNDTEVGTPAHLVVSFRNTGNVAVTPSIDCRISFGGTQVGAVSNDDTSVKPDETKDIPIDWDTTNAKTGNYTAELTITLNGQVIKTQQASFKVMPAGTYTMEGELTSLACQGEADIGSMVKLLAQFKNTGEADTMAKLKVEVNKGGTLVDVLESDQVLVSKGQVGTLTAYFKPEEKAVYTLTGVATYAGKQTDQKTLTIDLTSGKEVEPVGQTVTSTASGGAASQGVIFGLSWTAIGAIGGGLLIIIIVILFLNSKR